jgi:hypothetical protein
MSEYHNQWFVRMALMTAGTANVSVPALLVPASGLSLDRVPSRARALRSRELDMVCSELKHDVG